MASVQPHPAGAEAFDVEIGPGLHAGAVVERGLCDLAPALCPVLIEHLALILDELVAESGGPSRGGSERSSAQVCVGPRWVRVQVVGIPHTDGLASSTGAPVSRALGLVERLADGWELRGPSPLRLSFAFERREGRFRRRTLSTAR